MTQIPRFIEILSLAKTAHELGRHESGDRRKNKCDYEGCLPKRKHGPYRICERVKKVADIRIIFSTPELKLLAAAYDQGILDRHEEGHNDSTSTL